MDISILAIVIGTAGTLISAIVTIVLQKRKKIDANIKLSDKLEIKEAVNTTSGSVVLGNHNTIQINDTLTDQEIVHIIGNLQVGKQNKISVKDHKQE